MRPSTSTLCFFLRVLSTPFSLSEGHRKQFLEGLLYFMGLPVPLPLNIGKSCKHALAPISWMEVRLEDALTVDMST